MRKNWKYWALGWLAALSIGQGAWAQSCPQACPEGTKPSTVEAYWRGDAATFSLGCTTYCEPIAPCRAPSVAVVVGDHFDCALPAGFVPLTDAAAVDFSFAQAWDPVSVLPSDLASCSNRVHDGAEGDVDCGAVCASACANGLGCRADADCNQDVLCSRARCGGFQPPQTLTLPLPTISVQDLRVDDWTGDGLDDLLVYANAPQSALYLFPGEGDGAFRLGSQALLEVVPQTLHMGWLNGQPTAVVVGNGSAQVVEINQGILQSPQTVSLLDGSTPTAAYPFQYNGEAWLLTTGLAPGPRLVHVAGLLPDQYLSAFSDLTGSQWVALPAPAGDTPLVTVDAENLWLHRPNGGGTFLAPEPLLPDGTLASGYHAFSVFGDGGAQGGVSLITPGGSTSQQAQVVRDPFGAPSIQTVEIPFNASLSALAVGDFGGGPSADYAMNHGYGLYLYFDAPDGASLRPSVYMSHVALTARIAQGRNDLAAHLLLTSNMGAVTLLAPGDKP